MYYPINFKTNTANNPNNPNVNVRKRFARMAIGTLVGVAASFTYCKCKKKYTGKKLWLNALETGAAAGLLTDIVCLTIEIPANLKKTRLAKNAAVEPMLNIEPYKNKEFFI